MLPIISRSSLLQNPDQAAHQLEDSGINHWLAHSLALRGVNSKEIAFYQHRLLPVSGLKGIKPMAVEMAQSIVAGERLTVVADYDCDGATACAVAVAGLRSMGAKVDFVVPNRFIHGYGLTSTVVDVVLERFPDTKKIITVDNGIASVEGVEAANRHGLKVLVTDHHLPGNILPAAQAIVNPNQPGCDFQSKNLAGVGVMYYVLAAVREVLVQHKALPPEAPPVASFLDIVALGTVADVVKLDPNNRWLVQQGLRRIRSGAARPGIQALFEASKRNSLTARSQDFGFGLGPRINAAGRLRDMSVGIQCLLAEDMASAYDLALMLDDLNRERRQIEDGMKDIAELAIERAVASQESIFTRVAYHESFHEGVIGIVAGRIKEKAGVPTIVFAEAQEDHLIKGSGRSIPEAHLRDILDIVHKRGNGLLVKFGGHAMAAGLTLPKDRLPEFKVLFEQATREWLNDQLPSRFIEVDGELPASALSDIDTVRALTDQVWGQGFEEPIWGGEFEILEAKLIGADKNHLKMKVSKDGEEFTALKFFCEDLPQSTEIRLTYKVSLNEFRGKTETNLIVVDFENTNVGQNFE